MTKDELENYLNQLKDLDKILSNSDEEADFDASVMKEVTNIFNLLNGDVDDHSVLNVKIKKLHPNAIIPSYSKDGDAGMDLTVTEIINETVDKITYGFGIAVEIPKGYVGLLFPRSSIGKYNLSMTNSVGCIDSGFRGELISIFKKTSYDENSLGYYKIGDRAAQLMIMPYPKINFIESNELSETERGIGGHGSTGK